MKVYIDNNGNWSTVKRTISDIEKTVSADNFQELRKGKKHFKNGKVANKPTQTNEPLNVLGLKYDSTKNKLIIRLEDGSVVEK